MKLGEGVGSGEVDPGRIMGKSGRENMNSLNKTLQKLIKYYLFLKHRVFIE